MKTNEAERLARRLVLQMGWSTKAYQSLRTLLMNFNPDQPREKDGKFAGGGGGGKGTTSQSTAKVGDKMVHWSNHKTKYTVTRVGKPDKAGQVRGDVRHPNGKTFKNVDLYYYRHPSNLKP